MQNMHIHKAIEEESVYIEWSKGAIYDTWLEPTSRRRWGIKIERDKEREREGERWGDEIKRERGGAIRREINRTRVPYYVKLTLLLYILMFNKI